MKFSCLAVLVLLVSACSFAPQGSDSGAEFYPPLVSPHWYTEQYTLQNGSKACAVSSGPNGLSVILSQTGEEVHVKSNRRMAPGATFTVNVGGTHFQTSDESFALKSAQALAGKLAKADKAYLEWAEFNGPTNAPVHVQNILRLDGFRAQLKQCRDSLALKQ